MFVGVSVPVFTFDSGGEIGSVVPTIVPPKITSLTPKDAPIHSKPTKPIGDIIENLEYTRQPAKSQSWPVSQTAKWLRCNTTYRRPSKAVSTAVSSTQRNGM